VQRDYGVSQVAADPGQHAERRLIHGIQHPGQ
jgi:hypothetical protein